MFSIVRAVPAIPAIFFSFAVMASIGHAQSLPPAQRQVTGPVDDHALTRLPGNVYPMARAEYDHGRVADSLPQNHILMMLKRSAAQEQALDELMQEQYDPKSPNFHKWLTPEEYGSLFGPSMEDINQITGWLTQHGFTVNRVAPGRTFIDFSGTAGQVAAAFHTEIHLYQVKGEQHYANASEPMIPTVFAPLVSGFRALNNFHPKPLARTPGVARLDQPTGKWARVAPGGHLTNGTGANATYLVGPQDFAKIYGLNQVWAQTIESNGTKQQLVGTGQTIGVVGDIDLNSADIDSFRSQFGINTLGPNGSVVVDHPPSTVCAAPDPSANDVEGYIDAEWAGSTAPDATIDFVTCADNGVTAGADLAATYIVQDPAHAAQDSVLSTSWGYCEANPISESDQFYVALWQQAAAEGITVVVAAGDAGAAECDEFSPNPYAVQGLAVSAEASTPYNIAVGGTDFSDVFSGTTADYWSSTNGANLESALSYIPEMTWNDSCASPLVLEAFGQGYGSNAGSGGFCTYASQLPVDPNTAFSPYFNHFAGSGGLSTVSARPSWQTGVEGIPSGTARALPDISLFAGDGYTWGHALLFCDSYYLPSGVTCDLSDPNNVYDNEDGGTSFAAPAFAGIMALVNQKNGGRQGQANKILYPLAGEQYVSGGDKTTPSLANCAAYLGTDVLSSCYFHDISGTPNPDPATQAQTPFFIGNISVPCTGSATAPGVFTDTSTDPASHSANCYDYQITVTGSGGNLITTPNYYGVLSTADDASSPAYSATPGYDLATGLGSPNVFALVNAPQWSGPVASSTTLTSSSATVGTGMNVTFTATVSGSGGVPTGTVTFYNGTASIGTGTLTNGVATVTTSFSTAGTVTILATYGGDANFTGSTSAPLTETIVTPGFTASASPATLTIPFAGSGMVVITVTPQGGFTGPVNFSCGKLPAFFSCGFATPSVVFTVSDGTQTNTLTIYTATRPVAAALPPGSFPGKIMAATAFWMPVSAGFLIYGRRKRRNTPLVRICMLALLSIGFAGISATTGCGQPAHQAPDGAYTVPVNLTSSGGVSQTINLVVHVQ